MTAICVPIFVKGGVNLEEIIEEAEDALDGTSGMIELRCDQATPRLMLEAMEFAHLPVIITVRPAWEGGFCEKDDGYRLGLWEAAMEQGAEYVDVELVAWEKNKDLRDRICEAAEKHGTRIILSNHSFEGRPKDLDGRIARLRRIKQADLLKIVWKAQSTSDGADALRLCAEIKKEDRRPLVALAMGEEGVISRLLAKKFGAAFTFAALDVGTESAPGQPTVEELRERYRWERQRAETPVYGVVGWPVGQSKGPLIHNTGFDAVGAEGIYVPLAVKPGEFTTAIDALRAVPGMNLRGISVTIPHKESAFKYVRDHNGKIDDLSLRIGVLNTLVWGDAELNGFNSDYEGALDALASAWTGNREDLRGKRVAVMGAGGAARAIVAGLAAQGAAVVIYNRTREKAEALAAEFAPTPAASGGAQVLAAPWERLRDSHCEVYVNCTPLGMYPHVDASPIDFDPPATMWNAETVVLDTVYNPPMTKLLKLAREKGTKVVPGTEMFVRQAAAQFKAFTGKDVAMEVFRKAMNGRRIDSK